MPSVTGAPYPECFETETPTVKPAIKPAHPLDLNYAAKVNGDTEFSAALARADKDIAANDRRFNELKMTHLENTVRIYQTMLESKTQHLKEVLAERDEKPVVSCYAEVNEIVRTLADGINSIEPDYKAMCLRIALRSVRDLVDVLCEKTDNTGGAVIGVGSRARLDSTLEIARTQELRGE